MALIIDHKQEPDFKGLVAHIERQVHSQLTMLLANFAVKNMEKDTFKELMDEYKAFTKYTSDKGVKKSMLYSANNILEDIIKTVHEIHNVVVTEEDGKRVDITAVILSGLKAPESYAELISESIYATFPEDEPEKDTPEETVLAYEDFARKYTVEILKVLYEHMDELDEIEVEIELD